MVWPSPVCFQGWVTSCAILWQLTYSSPFIHFFYQHLQKHAHVQTRTYRHTYSTLHFRVIGVIILLWNFGGRILVFAFFFLVLILIPKEDVNWRYRHTAIHCCAHFFLGTFLYLAFRCHELPSKFNAVFFSEPGGVPNDEAESHQSR